MIKRRIGKSGASKEYAELQKISKASILPVDPSNGPSVKRRQYLRGDEFDYTDSSESMSDDSHS